MVAHHLPRFPFRGLLLLVLAGFLLPLPATATELTLLRTIGSEEDEVLIHRPQQVTFGPDGSIYVLNGGDCRILRFDRDWNFLGGFAKCGQGPGEFENATGLILHREKLWVFEMARATLFDLDGEYLETVRTELQLKSAVVRGDEILCLLDGSDRAACRVDDKLDLIAKLGPECTTDNFFERYKTCGFMHVVLHPDYLCLLINPLDGKLHAVGPDGEVVRTASLAPEVGDSDIRREDEAVTMNFSLVLGRGFVDDAGRLWCLPLPDSEEDETEGPRIVEVRDHEFKPFAIFELPEAVRGYQLVQSPDGNLVLLDANESLIHLLEFPDLEFGKR